VAIAQFSVSFVLKPAICARIFARTVMKNAITVLMVFAATAEAAAVICASHVVKPVPVARMFAQIAGRARTAPIIARIVMLA